MKNLYLLFVIAVIILATACTPLVLPENQRGSSLEQGTPEMVGGSTNSPLSPATSPVMLSKNTTPSEPTPVYSPTPAPSPLPTATFELLTDKPIGGYIFNPPKLILETDKPIEVVQWMPDSNEELLVRSSTINKFTVEIFNVKTGQRRSLLETDSLVGKPVWLPATQQLAYLSYDTTNNVNLFLSDINSQNKKFQIASNVNMPLVPNPDGSKVLILDNQMTQLKKVGQKSEEIQHLNLTKPLSPPKAGPMAQYQAAWSNNTNWIAYYNQETFKLVNQQTSVVKDVDLGQTPNALDKLWVSCAVWSPNGEKLALIVGAGGDVPLLFTKLAVLNPETNEFQIIENDVLYVTSITWAPDNQQILMQAQTGIKDGRSIIGLFLADSFSKKVSLVPALPAEASQTTFCNGIVWSPDGSYVITTYDKMPGDGNVGWYRININRP